MRRAKRSFKSVWRFSCLTLKYQAICDAEEMLGGVDNICATFIDYQKYLYEEVVS